MTAPTVRRHSPRARWKGVVYSEPKDGRYRQAASHPWGTPVELPAPVGFTLDTEELKDYAD
ncbi:hypothetical protein ACFY64_25080 [Streptomyces collinus]|uniref:hypothetical protein n=1 Tax=Streptomyces collinus TaxID=42684 RepID=UPI0036A7F8E1